MTHKNFSTQQMNDYEEILNKFWENNGNKPAAPFDIFKVLHELGFKVYSGNLGYDNVDGFILVDETKSDLEKNGRTVSGNKFIAVNEKYTDMRTIKFIVAHELCHYILKKVSKPDEKIIVALREHTFSKEGEERPELEQVIDYMACAFLVPRESLLSDLQRFNYSNVNVDEKKSIVKRLSDFYRVDEELMIRRVEEVI